MAITTKSNQEIPSMDGLKELTLFSPYTKESLKLHGIKIPEYLEKEINSLEDSALFDFVYSEIKMDGEEEIKKSYKIMIKKDGVWA